MAAANLCLLIFGLWMLDRGDLPHAFIAWNYLNVLGAWELSCDKNELKAVNHPANSGGLQ